MAAAWAQIDQRCALAYDAGLEAGREDGYRCGWSACVASHGLQR